MRGTRVGRRIFNRLRRGYKIISRSEKEEKVEKIKPEIVQIIERLKEPVVEKEKEEIVEETEKKEGLEIPEFMFEKKVKVGGLYGTKEEEKKLSLVYPLIPNNPAKGEPIFAYVKIFWDDKSNRYVYQVIEPPLSDKLKDTIRKIRNLIEQRLDVDFSKLKRFEAEEYLHKQVEELLSYYNIKLSDTENKILHYYIIRDFIGLGKIEPIMSDEQIEDISCDGVGVPLFVFHRNPKLGSLVTNVTFDSPEELDSFVMRLAQMTGKSVSILNPLLSGILPDGSRVQATLATDIARKGSNFTIRKFISKPLTPIHLLNYNTLDLKMLAYLWMAVDFGRSILVSGGTASGKTSLLNILSLFIRPEKKIVSIEDTAELKLPHPHWIPHVARVPISAGKMPGEIDLFDLLKESLRQRPDYIIVGEVRGPEAFVLFQEMATGHPSLSTIHAENIPRLIDRLTTPPISLPPSLIEALDAIVFMTATRFRDLQVRRVTEIVEITGFDRKTNMPKFNQVFRWDPMSDKFLTVNKSFLLESIAEEKGIKKEHIIEEFERRMLVLNWLKEQNISEYQDIYNVLGIYYTDPERVISVIKGEV
jgi:flagellar protein FlaI